MRHQYGPAEAQAQKIVPVEDDRWFTRVTSVCTSLLITQMDGGVINSHGNRKE